MVRNKVISFAAAVAVAASMITPVMAANIGSATNTGVSSSTTTAIVTDSEGNAKSVAVETTTDSSAVSRTDAAVLVVNTEKTEHVQAVEAEITKAETTTAYIQSLPDVIANAVTEALGGDTSVAQVVGVINIDANQLMKDLTSSAVVKLPVDGATSSDKFVLVHYGTNLYEEIPANAGDGYITFTVDPSNLSPFVVLKVAGTGSTSSSSSSSSTKSDWTPSYEVVFHDANGNVISTQWVAEGQAAEIPAGYTYAEASLYWVYQNMSVYPVGATATSGYTAPNTAAK